MAKTKQTASMKLKAKILAILKDLLNNYADDLESGIDDGLYTNKADNERNRQFVTKTEKLIEEFQKDQPVLYIYVEGGLIQGISSTVPIGLNIFDKDNYQSGEDQKEFIENYGTPDEWDKKIKSLTRKKVIIPVH
jgi:hypothetical protein